VRRLSCAGTGIARGIAAIATDRSDPIAVHAFPVDSQRWDVAFIVLSNLFLNGFLGSPG
jgi:hypothetical protein